MNRYWCFLSYRHADNQAQDREWASWLHQEIERYSVPSDLVGTTNERGDVIPERIYPVFRDEESLPADADLSTAITAALDRSRFLVVLCSPRAVESRYVGEEILHFKREGRADRILAVILAGEPNVSRDAGKRAAGHDARAECFPEALRHPLGKDGMLVTSRTVEPVAANLRLKDGTEGFTTAKAYRRALSADASLEKAERDARVDAYAEQLELMKLKVVAGILAVPLEQLRDRDRRHQIQLAQRRSRALRRWLILVSALMVVAIGAGVLAWFEAREANRQRGRAEESAEEAARQAREAQRGEGQFWLELARQQVVDDGSSVWPETALYAAKAIGFAGLGRPDDFELRPASERAFWERAHFPLLDRVEDAAGYREALRLVNAVGRGVPRARPLRRAPALAHHEQKVAAVAYAPDGRMLASGDYAGVVALWEASTGRLLRRFEAHDDRIVALGFSPDGRWLATGSADTRIRIWEPQAGTLHATLNGHRKALTSLSFARSAGLLASGSQDGTAIVWNVASGTLHRRITLPDHDWVWSLALHPEGRTLVTGASSFHPDTAAALTVWDLETGEPAWSVRTHDHGIRSVTFSPDGTKIFTGAAFQRSSDDPIEPRVAIGIWGARDGVALGQLDGHHDAITSLTFAPGGRQLLSSSMDGTARIWDPAVGREIRRLSDAGSGLFGAAWRPDGAVVAAAPNARRVLQWDAATGSLIRDRTAPATRVSFRARDGLLAVGHADGTVALWDAGGREPRQAWTAHRTGVSGLAFSPDGRWLATAGGGSRTEPARLRVWDADKGELVTLLWEQKPAILCAAFSPDGSLLVAGGGFGTLKTFSTDHWREVRSEKAHPGGAISGLAFHPEGRLLATGGRDFAVRIWEVSTGDAVRVMDRAHQDRWVNDLAFSPDGQLLATAGSSYPSQPDAVRLWDVATWDLRTSLPVPHGLAVAWHPSGTALATGAWGDRVELWRVTTGGRTARLSGHGPLVGSVAFSPDGRHLATSGRVRLWDVGLGQSDRSWAVHDACVGALDLHPAGDRVVTASGWKLQYGTLVAQGSPGEVRVWRTADGASLERLGPEGAKVTDVAWSPAGTAVATCEAGGPIRLWDGTSGAETRALEGARFEELREVTWSPDGRRVAAASATWAGGARRRRIRIWETGTGREVAGIEVDATVADLAFAPAGDRLAAALSSNVVRTWRPDGTERETLYGHTASVEALAFHPGGRLLASASSSEDGTIRVWDLDAGEARWVLEGHGRRVSITCLAFSPDGTTLASGTDNPELMQREAPERRWKTEIRLWDVKTGTLTGALRVPHLGVYGLAFGPRGHTLYAAADDGRIRVWNLAPTDWACHLRLDWFGLDRAARSIRWADTTDDLRRARRFEGAWSQQTRSGLSSVRRSAPPAR